MRIPKKVYFPWGYVIDVKQVSDTYFKDELGAEDADGLWDVDEKTIYIRKSASLLRKVRVFCHECQHALTDFEWAMLDRAGMRFRKRQQS